MDNEIDLNQADRDTLAGLPGIGEKLAERIIEYRESAGPFSAVSELTAVSGISESMVQSIEDQLVVTASPEADTVESIEEPPIEEIAVLSNSLGGAAEDDTPDEAPPTTEPIAAAEPPPKSPPPASSNSGFKEHLFTAIIGALLGTLLTLTALWLLNGSLQLNERAQMRAVEQQSAHAAATIQADLTSMRYDLQVVNTQVAEMTTRESESAVTVATTQADLKTAHDTLSDTINEVATLETAIDGLDKRITVVAASAESFDAFMVGMRDLLWVLQGPPPTPEATTTSFAMTVTATATVTPTVDATVTATSIATRTPRPTATPLGEAMPTAAPTE